MAGKQITNDTLYSRMDSIRIELKGDILTHATEVKNEVADLRRRFEVLEEGRVSGVEKAVADLRANQSIANFKVMVVWGLIIVAANAALTIVIGKALR